MHLHIGYLNILNSKAVYDSHCRDVFSVADAFPTELILVEGVPIPQQNSLLYLAI